MDSDRVLVLERLLTVRQDELDSLVAQNERLRLQVASKDTQVQELHAELERERSERMIEQTELRHLRQSLDLVRIVFANELS